MRKSMMRAWKTAFGCVAYGFVLVACGASTEGARAPVSAPVDHVEAPAHTPPTPIGVRYDDALHAAECLRAALTFRVDEPTARRLVAQPDAALLVVGNAPDIDAAMLVIEARATTEDDLFQMWRRLHELVSGELVGDDLVVTALQIGESGSAGRQLRATYSASSDAPSYRFSAHVRRRHGAMCTIAIVEPSEQRSAFAQVFEESVQRDVPAGFFREPETPRSPDELGAVRAVVDVLRFLFQ